MCFLFLIIGILIGIMLTGVCNCEEEDPDPEGNVVPVDFTRRERAA